jgi:hypothetical protein
MEDDTPTHFTKVTLYVDFRSESDHFDDAFKAAGKEVRRLKEILRSNYFQFDSEWSGEVQAI